MSNPSVVGLTTGSRLHFGLLAHSHHAARQFGGLGLMVDRPGLALSARPSQTWRAEGPLSDRVLRFASRVCDGLRAMGIEPSPASIRVHHAAREHSGLGTGTQLGLAIARIVSTLAGQPDLPAATLAVLSGRGLRSGIGLHGFVRGGLLVDGGRRLEATPPPLIARLDWPEPWSALVVLPPVAAGLHGAEEIHAFSKLPPIPDHVTDRLCRLALLGLLPSVADEDLATFGESLTELQRLVGQCFAPAQHGIFAHPELDAIVLELRSLGLHGVGQSSWGPAIYGFSDAPTEERAWVSRRVMAQFNLDPSAVFWTQGKNEGAELKALQEEP